jgi:RNA polymerase sigma-32 factor
MSLPILADGLQRYMAEINRFPLLSRAEEYEVAVQYRQTGDREAAQKLVLSNLRFVVKIAHEYKSYGFRLADLVQEGNIGLLTAVKKFEPEKGYRLISYAVWWIRAHIQNFILRSWSLVRIGTTQAQRKLFYKLKQTKRKLLGHIGEEDRDAEGINHRIAEKLALKESEVLEMDQRLSGRDLSLNVPVDDESHLTHMDLLAAPDNQEEIVADYEEKLQVSQHVKMAMKNLTPREEFIVKNRLMADEPMTLQEIGNRYGISRERTRQLEARAKKKLKAVLQEAA